MSAADIVIDTITYRRLGGEWFAVSDIDGVVLPHVETWSTCRALDEIERLRAEVLAEGNDANLLMLEIERLRAALALAAGELSTYGHYRYTSPEQLMEYFIHEATQ